MNNLYFDDVIQIGRLYLEYIFYEIRYGQKWIVTSCSIGTLKALIEEDIDIASAFLMTSQIITIDMDLQGNKNSCIIENVRIDRLDLPKEGTYIRCDKEKARNYLWNKEFEVFCEQLRLNIVVLGSWFRKYINPLRKPVGFRNGFFY